MIKKEKFPILEFDSHRKARINPSDITSSASLKSPYLVITFFYEIIKRLLKEKKIKKYLKIKGENDLILYKFTDSDVYLMPGIIGGPATGGYLDELSGYGIKKVIFCGGGGVLSKEIETGKLLLVTGAIRDEGFSYHYLKPSRIVYSSKPILKTMENYLDEKGISYLKGLVWTTDCYYRETKGLVERRKKEGALMVEMEQSACLAVAKFRHLSYGAILYAGDDVSSDIYDKRDWRKKGSVRYELVLLCKNLVLKF